MNNVGLTMKEGVASGAIAARDTAKRNIGLLGQFTRGVAFSPQRIESKEDFNRIFGGANANFYGPTMVKSIFDEAQNAPVTLYIARVVGVGATPATGTISVESASMTATSAYKGAEDKGVWGNGTKVTLYSYGSLMKDQYVLKVEHNHETEQFNAPSLSLLQDYVNKASKFVMVSFSQEIDTLTLEPIAGTISVDAMSTKITGAGTSFQSELAVGTAIYDSSKAMLGVIASITSDTEAYLRSPLIKGVSTATITKRKDSIYTTTIGGGSDGKVTEADFYQSEDSLNPKGLACFDGVDIQILATTEYHTPTMAQKLNAYVSERKNPLGVVNLPLNADEGIAEVYASLLQTQNTSFMAGAYLGWVQVYDETGNIVTIPSIAPILGAAYIRAPYLNGNYIHIPTAGIDSAFSSVLSVIQSRLSQSTINHLVQDLSCNVIRYNERYGYYVGSSRTYSLNELYQSIHIRLQTSYYLRVLKDILMYAEQQPNTPELRNDILSDLYQYFKTEYQNGALERSIPFNQCYQGICDKSNNPDGQDRKVLNVTILWVPTECTESISITLQRNDGILLTKED